MLKKLWKKFECLMFGHDLEVVTYDIVVSYRRNTITVMRCRHCGKVFVR